HARAGAGVAVDHQGRLVGQNNFQRFVRAATLKASVTWPEHKALHPSPARDEEEAFGRKMLVILSARWIDEMDGGYVAFTAIGRGHTTQAANRQDARRQPVIGNGPNHNIKRYVVTAHDHKIGCPYRTAYQSYLSITPGIKR